MPAVDEDGELDAVGPPVVEQRLDRRADGAPGVENVVDEHDRLPLEREVECRGAHDRLRVTRCVAAADLDVVAVEGDVHGSQRGFRARALLDEPAQTMRERHAARLDPDECYAAEIWIAFDDLVRNAGERSLETI